jgi:hypothetical protein
VRLARTVLALCAASWVSAREPEIVESVLVAPLYTLPVASTASSPLVNPENESVVSERLVPVAEVKSVLPKSVVEASALEKVELKTDETVELPRIAKEVVVAFVNKVAPLSVEEARRFWNVELKMFEIVVEPVTARLVVVPFANEKLSPVTSPALLMLKSVVVEKTPAMLEEDAIAKSVVRVELAVLWIETWAHGEVVPTPKTLPAVEATVSPVVVAERMVEGWVNGSKLPAAAAHEEELALTVPSAPTCRHRVPVPPAEEIIRFVELAVAAEISPVVLAPPEKVDNPVTLSVPAAAILPAESMVVVAVAPKYAL